MLVETSFWGKAGNNLATHRTKDIREKNMQVISIENPRWASCSAVSGWVREALERDVSPKRGAYSFVFQTGGEQVIKLVSESGAKAYPTSAATYLST